VSKPLTGIRVLDLSKVLAGPLCAQYLGDLGADIIKVETVGQGDETRGWPPFPAPGLGTVFLSANRNKRSIAVDMKTEKGREIIHALAKSADVAIESFGTGVAERLGIDASTLRSLNDRLIHCSISGFGRSGPLKNSPGYDVILQAFCGIMSMTGDEDGGYIRSPISPIDQTTGVHAFSGILALLYAREKTGEAAKSRSRCSKLRWACWATISRHSGSAAFSRRNAVQATNPFAPTRHLRPLMVRS
jgi:crotonobetainyl-CoA:carnitine CoA-transferase CaiB-like acyl-CoA transferase